MVRQGAEHTVSARHQEDGGCRGGHALSGLSTQRGDRGRLSEMEGTKALTRLTVFFRL